MTKQLDNYQCPACMGPLHFAGDSGMLECEYCGNAYDVAEIERIQGGADPEAEDDWETGAEESTDGDEGSYTPGGENWAPEGMKAYSCPSCGAELVCDETTAATSCPYCGNPGIIQENFADMLRPDYVLPFRLDKEQAVAALKKYYRGKPLLPGAFSRENHINEIKGVYVPFWLYDGQVEADIRYSATRVFSVTNGDTLITTTEHYRLRRAGAVSFERIPVDGSSKMPDAHMDAIEPFDYSQMKPFSPGYLPGYLADRYDVDYEKCAERADERAKSTAVSLMGESAGGYATCIPVSQQLRLHRHGVSYALLPVWMLSTRWKNKTFLFAMNGQTGKLIGDLPISWGRLAAWFLGIFAPLTGLMYLLLG